MNERMELPEATSGDFSIRHERVRRGEELDIVNSRTAIYAGLPPCKLKVARDTTFHSLCEGDDGIWMTDKPNELLQMDLELARGAYGKVLIGGLGLGIVANMMARKKSVRRITVVELSSDVIRLISPYLPKKVEVVEGDIHEYVHSLSRGQFDAALLDTWTRTGEWIWQTEVVPLRRLIGYKIPRVACWQEDVMKGQVWQALQRMAEQPEDLLRDQDVCHYYAFRCAIGERLGRPARIPSDDLGNPQQFVWAEENRKDPEVRELARIFLHEVGTERWEEWFGKYWDEAWAMTPEILENVHHENTSSHR
jgi:hypothetical protein